MFVNVLFIHRSVGINHVWPYILFCLNNTFGDSMLQGKVKPFGPLFSCSLGRKHKRIKLTVSSSKHACKHMLSSNFVHYFLSDYRLKLEPVRSMDQFQNFPKIAPTQTIILGYICCSFEPHSSWVNSYIARRKEKAKGRRKGKK